MSWASRRGAAAPLHAGGSGVSWRRVCPCLVAEGSAGSAGLPGLRAHIAVGDVVQQPGEPGVEIIKAEGCPAPVRLVALTDDPGFTQDAEVMAERRWRHVGREGAAQALRGLAQDL